MKTTGSRKPHRAPMSVLRHTGIRVEELVELTHLSVRQYQRPSGEVIALLVIAPSKSNRERVIPMSAELFHVIATIIRRHTVHGPIPLLPRYDGHERTWTAPMPYLFQRQIGSVRRVMSTGTALNILRRRCELIAETDPRFRGLHFTPHGFRRLFATELMNNGLPIHIGAALLGHLNLQTTRGYVAVFEEDVTRHYQEFLARRRDLRPTEEYRPATEEEMTEFEEHFDKRKVELGSCGSPYGTPCQHEHACIHCPMLHINRKMLSRLDELEADLHERKKRASAEGWIGEVEGIDLTLRFLTDSRRRGRLCGARHGRPHTAIGCEGWRPSPGSRCRSPRPAGRSGGSGGTDRRSSSRDPNRICGTAEGHGGLREGSRSSGHAGGWRPVWRNTASRGGERSRWRQRPIAAQPRGDRSTGRAGR
ncbi:tyrosine-type recombinase/integrase [Actinomadura opuntiae]|uniref:tyrosine-type recombinase/integrase n=1 Tax=Actinomadura sp. OS1-43 TaxID=604315 RepID=UPI00255B40B8|nr:tyrosine-type recombinase/integrase [Actinomadura sp. OS1-43]MDL4817373.1 tyrosine-type recombinase/integrase [Actinomadura sp. OS1-43]